MKKQALLLAYSNKKIQVNHSELSDSDIEINKKFSKYIVIEPLENAPLSKLYPFLMKML